MHRIWRKARLFLLLTFLNDRKLSEPKDNVSKPKPNAAFTWKDALNLESSLTEEEIMVRDQFHVYCQSKLMPRVIEANRHGSEW